MGLEVTDDRVHEGQVDKADKEGKRKWKEKVVYGNRWLIESFFSTFERWFGEYVVSKRLGNIRNEHVFKVGIMIMMMRSGGMRDGCGGVDVDEKIIRSGRS